MSTESNPVPLDLDREKLIEAGRLHWFHWLVIALSLVLTFGAWYFAQSQVDEKVEAQFQREAAQSVELISERMQKYEDALWGGVGAIQAQGGDINHTDWLTFSETLSLVVKYPGINGIGVIHSVQPEQLPGYLEEQRRLRPDYAIHPAHGESEYLPITYIEPVATNQKAVGLDMAHEANRYNAAKKARDTGTAQITGPITLVQDAQKTPGFVLRTLLRRRHIRGRGRAPGTFLGHGVRAICGEKTHGRYPRQRQASGRNQNSRRA